MGAVEKHLYVYNPGPAQTYGDMKIPAKAVAAYPAALVQDLQDHHIPVLVEGDAAFPQFWFRYNTSQNVHA